jgi:hypothetical protein
MTKKALLTSGHHDAFVEHSKSLKEVFQTGFISPWTFKDGKNE